MEHHSNIVPWQILCEQTGAVLKVIPINDAGELDMDEYKNLLGERSRIVTITHVSNALGTASTRSREITALAHGGGCRGNCRRRPGRRPTPGWTWPRWIVTSMPSPAINCSAPPESACCTGSRRYWTIMPPYHGGGDMIKMVTFEKTLYNDLPYKFEAGTPYIAGVIGLGAAVDYVSQVGPGPDPGLRTRVVAICHPGGGRCPGSKADRHRSREGSYFVLCRGRDPPP